MIPPETYFQFHLAFTLPPIAVLLVVCWRCDTLPDGPGLVGLAVILALAVGYTTPWDNLLIEAGTWSYGEGVVWRTLWAAPVGEYLFFVFQPIVTVLFLSLLSVPTDTDIRLPRRDRLRGLVAGLGVTTLGVVLLFAGQSWLYLGSVLAWSGPVLALQWAFGWPHLWRARRAVAVGIAVPTLYFWMVDWTALSLGLWTVSGTHTVGLAPFGFPVEEAVFFLVTNVFVVQGYVLYLWLVAQWPTVVDSPVLARYRRYLPAPVTDIRNSGD